MASPDTELYPSAVSKHSRDSKANKLAERSLRDEWISGLTGAILAAFIWGHLVAESSILLGRDAYDTVAHFLEVTLPLAQPLIFIITFVFFVHFVWASRKIPGKLRQRKRMLELGLNIKGAKKKWKQNPESPQLRSHFETSLWIWQVRTGMIVLATGAFHLFLVAWNLFSDMGIDGQAPGFTSDVSTGRVSSGLWILYAVLMSSTVAHMAIGVYRLLVKWFADTWFKRKYAKMVFYFLFWFFIILGSATVLGLAGPLEGVLQ